MGYMPFDFNQITAATGFNYPDGDYIFEVETTEERVNQDGQQKRLLVGSKIIMGPWASEEYKGRKLSNSYQYSQKGAQFIKRLLYACGFTDEVIRQNGGRIDPNWLHGKQFVATVTKKDQYTNVSNERPLSEWDPTKAPTATTATGVPVSAPPPSIMQPVQTVQPQIPQAQTVVAPQVQPPVVGAPPVQPPAVAQAAPPATQVAPPVAQAAPPVMPTVQAAAPSVQPAVQPAAPPTMTPPAMPAPPPVVAAPPATAIPPTAPQQPVAQSPQPTAGPVGIPAPAPPPGTPVQQ